MYAFEQQEQDARSYMSGGQVGHINSELLKSQGVPEVDELVFMNDWMLRHNNRPNPGLIRKYAANSGACFDWLFGDFIDDPASVVVRQWPANDSYQQEIGGLRGFVGCAHTGDFMTQALDHCAQVVESNGGKIYYGTSGYLLTTDDAGAVTGAYGEKSDGTYVKVEAAKGVILAGGGFGGNADMLTDLYTESLGLKPEGETLSAGMDQDGSGVALGYWAGGKLDPCMSGMGRQLFLSLRLAKRSGRHGPGPVAQQQGKALLQRGLRLHRTGGYSGREGAFRHRGHRVRQQRGRLRVRAGSLAHGHRLLARGEPAEHVGAA